MTGANADFYNTAFPSATTSQVGEFQADSLDENIAQIPQIQQLTQLINEINQASQQTANAGRLPGGAGLEEASSANISSALAGELDPSVLQQLGQRSAERGIATGSPGGPSTNAEYLRSLGLNSLDLMNTGQNWLSQATARNPAAPIVGAEGLILTPQQAASLNLQQQGLAEQIRSNQAQEGIARSRGAGGVGGGNYGGGGGQSMSPGINWADLLSPTQTGSTTTGSGSFNVGWENDPFDWAWNGSTPATASTGWEDDPFAWAWE